MSVDIWLKQLEDCAANWLGEALSKQKAALEAAQARTWFHVGLYSCRAPDDLT